MSLVLSCFPGLGLLDRAFEDEGYCVVRGPDVVWGGDVRTFHPPAGRFDGIIGGDPCQSHSALSNLVRAKGLTPSFPDLTPEFERVIVEAQPIWFLRENVPNAPDIKPLGYEVTSFLLDNCWLGEPQMRKRRFWFGWVQERGPAPNLRKWIPGAALELAECVTAVGGHDGHADMLGSHRRVKSAPVTGRHDGAVGAVDRDYSPPRRTLAEMLVLQGFPPDMLDRCPLTMEGKRKAVGNGVPLPMGRALAQAVRKAMDTPMSRPARESATTGILERLEG